MASGVAHHIVLAGQVGVLTASLAAILVTIHLRDSAFEGRIRIKPDRTMNTLVHIEAFA